MCSHGWTCDQADISADCLSLDDCRRAADLLDSVICTRLSPASLTESLATARFSRQYPGQPPSVLPPISATLASLHLTLAAADTCQHDVLATMPGTDPAHQRDLLRLSPNYKLTTTSASPYFTHDDSPVKPDSSALNSRKPQALYGCKKSRKLQVGDKSLLQLLPSSTRKLYRVRPPHGGEAGRVRELFA